ncbi:PUB domain [Trypanosoma melophagium]|uniref:PUB domain n=1 Tax=Trypanosoma melophagium TaxID=715481 RepID=UPI003519F03F|nr:PUB domain [Trypanosoma melophagium]
MSSLSEEILKLSELFTNGILSDDEFKAAKEAAIKRYTVPSAPLSEDVKEQVPFSHVNISEFDEDTAGQSNREKAYGLIETILRNLQLYPTEQKYRRLRLRNPTLQSQLFSVPGTMTFLGSLGFVVERDEEKGEENMWLPEVPQKNFLNEALDAINFLRSRDREAQTHTRDYMRLRQNLSLAVRRERWERAKAVGELRAYIVQEFCADDAGDGLHTSASNLEKLLGVLTNILNNPTEGKYRKLRLSNNTVYRAVVQQRGGLELLLECAGAELVEEAGETYLVFRENAATQAGLESALRTLEDSQRAVQQAREDASRREREEALEMMRKEMRLARQQEGLQHSRVAKEGSEGKLEHPDGDGGHPPRRRVPIAEAVRHLMGRVGASERYGEQEEEGGGEERQ